MDGSPAAVGLYVQEEEEEEEENEENEGKEPHSTRRRRRRSRRMRRRRRRVRRMWAPAAVWLYVVVPVLLLPALLAGLLPAAPVEAPPALPLPWCQG